MSKKKEYGMKEYRHEQELRKNPEYAQFFDNPGGRGNGSFDYAAASNYEREQMMKDPTVLRGLETMNLAIKDKDFRATLDPRTQKAIQDRVDSGEGIKAISNYGEMDFYNNFYKNYSKHDAGITNHNSANDTGQVYFKQGSDIRDNHLSGFAKKDDLKDMNAPEDQQSAATGATTEIDEVPPASAGYESYLKNNSQDIEAFGRTEVSPFGDQGEPFAAGNKEMQQEEAASNFLEKYKLDLVKGLRLTPTLS